MRLALFILMGVLYISPANAKKDDIFYGRMEIGSFGDLAYVRNKDGAILKKRTDEEIRQHVATVVNEKLKASGLSVFPTNRVDLNQIVLEDDKIKFSVYNQNGDKLYDYVIDRASGYTSNELGTVRMEEAELSEKAQKKAFRHEETLRRKELLKKINEEEAQKKVKK